MKSRFFLFLILFTLIPVAIAQEAEVTVPDITGLNIPTAAAILNRAGLRLGEQVSEQWTEASGVPQNTIGVQSLEAGSTVEHGATVDVKVMRAPNARLLYDDNDLTLINRGDLPLNINGLAFNAGEGSNAAFTRWTGQLNGRYCLQVWSISRSNAKSLPNCNSINWLTTNNRAEHFWMTASGATEFTVLQDGVEIATCPAARPNTENNPSTCDMYIPAIGNEEFVNFVYFMYNDDRLIVKNPSQDKWFRTNQTRIFNENPNQDILGNSFGMGNRNLFGNPDIVADVRRLAPGQCLLFKRAGVPDEPLPDSCEVIATLELPAAQLFWLFNFEFQTGENTKRFKCPAAAAGKRTLCIMPRS